MPQRPAMYLAFAAATWLSVLSNAPAPAAHRHPAVGAGNPLSPVVSFRGADTHIAESVYLRLTTHPEWEQFWLKHTARAGTPEQYDQYRPTGVPAVDFERYMVVAITNSPGQLNAGITALDIRESEELIAFGYDNLYYQAPDGSSAPGNAFGFYVLPRSTKPIQFRVNHQSRQSRADGEPPKWEDVANVPELVEAAPPAADPTPSDESRAVNPEPTGWNIVFGQDPGPGQYKAAVGSPSDTWNLASVGSSELPRLRNSAGSETDVRLHLSENDGCWGIEGVTGAYHAYLYHNCCCVDLQAKLDGLPPGRYAAFVYAHGDAPSQNAEIELAVGAEVYGRKSTLNDGTWDFRSTDWKDGNQFVRFEFSVIDDEPVVFTSYRAGSDYSMLNAIQIVPTTSLNRR